MFNFQSANYFQIIVISKSMVLEFWQMVTHKFSRHYDETFQPAVKTKDRNKYLSFIPFRNSHVRRLTFADDITQTIIGGQHLWSVVQIIHLNNIHAKHNLNYSIFDLECSHTIISDLTTINGGGQTWKIVAQIFSDHVGLFQTAVNYYER